MPITSWRVWLWRWRNNPLRRRSDAIEAWTVLAAVLVAVAMGIASCVLTVDATLRAADHMREVRYEAAAWLTRDAPAAAQFFRGQTGADRVPAAVRWTTRDGSRHQGRARVEPGLKAGEETTIWVDAHGDPATQPPGTADGVLGAALAGAAATAAVGGAVGLCGRLVLRWLLRRRLEEWERDWARTAPLWGPRTS